MFIDEILDLQYVINCFKSLTHKRFRRPSKMFTAVVHYPEDETAYLAEPAISAAEQIASLRPANPCKDGNLPHHLEAMERAFQAVGKEVLVTGALTGPFTTASFLIGTENLARLTLKNPAAVHQLCEAAYQGALLYAGAILDTG